jgi:hypothetical protein
LSIFLEFGISWPQKKKKKKKNPSFGNLKFDKRRLARESNAIGITGFFRDYSNRIARLFLSLFFLLFLFLLVVFLFQVLSVETVET